MLCRISRRLRIRSVIRTREMNSLHSPMFPQPQQKFETEEAPRQKKESPDFLDAHGGKLILTVISTIGFFIYRWVKGGNNKLKVEDAVAHESPLHPYESHLFRSANSLSDEDFQHILQASRQKYPDGLISYEEFVRFIQENLPKSLSLTFYLDRVILFYLETIHQTSSNKVPLSIFLIALSNALQSSPQDRSELLFDVSQTMTSTEVQFLNNSPTPSSEDSLTTHSTPISSDYDPSLYCSLTHVKSLVNMLDIAWQIPYEKRVIESGVNWPFPEYRRKTSEELVQDGLAKMKPPPHMGGYLSRDEFSELILGTVICSWGECYRKK